MVNKNIPIFWYASLGSIALHLCLVSWMRYVMSRFQPTYRIQETSVGMAIELVGMACFRYKQIVELVNYNQIVELELELQQAR